MILSRRQALRSFTIPFVLPQLFASASTNSALRGKVRLSLTDVFGEPLPCPAHIALKDPEKENPSFQTTCHNGDMLVKDIPVSSSGSIYEVSAHAPPGFLRATDKITIQSDQVTSHTLKLFIHPDHIKEVVFDEFHCLPEDVRRLIQPSSILNSLSFQQNIGVRSILAKAFNTHLPDGSKITSYIQSIDLVAAQDRFFAKVDGKLFDQLHRGILTKAFDKVSSKMHHHPSARAEKLGAIKTKDHDQGLLNINMYRVDGEHIAEMDVDTNKGAAHFFGASWHEIERVGNFFKHGSIRAGQTNSVTIAQILARQGIHPYCKFVPDLA